MTQKKKLLEYQVYGADGNKRPFSYSRVLTNKEQKFSDATYLSFDDEEQTLKGLYPLEINPFPSSG